MQVSILPLLFFLLACFANTVLDFSWGREKHCLPDLKKKNKIKNNHDENRLMYVSFLFLSDKQMNLPGKLGSSYDFKAFDVLKL